LRHRFELIAASDLDAHREDKAATIRGALSTLRTARAVMIGDRSFDIIGAHVCAIPAIGVTWGIGSREELGAAGADAIIDTPAELVLAINRLLGARRHVSS
jgi:phosphoglycolate phosphatase